MNVQTDLKLGDRVEFEIGRRAGRSTIVYIEYDETKLAIVFDLHCGLWAYRDQLRKVTA